jgi:hypothetical protein
MMIDDFILAGAVHLLALVTGSVVWQWSPPLCCRAPARYQTCVLRLQPSKRLSADLSPSCAPRFLLAGLSGFSATVLADRRSR